MHGFCGGLEMKNDQLAWFLGFLGSRLAFLVLRFLELQSHLMVSGFRRNVQLAWLLGFLGVAWLS